MVENHRTSKDNNCSKADIYRSFPNIVIAMEGLHNKTIWILDDDKAIRSSLEMLLNDYFQSVRSFHSPESFLHALTSSTPHIVLMDMNYGRGEVDGRQGLNVLYTLKENYSSLPVVVMTAYSNIGLAVESMKNGASDFVNKPWSNERLVVTLSNVLRLESSRRELEQWQVRDQIDQKPDFNDTLGMIGSSPAMGKVRKQIKQIAPSDANVLLLGENGTGKELAAKAIHELSQRNRHPFVKIDLGSIHKDLFESELFGAKKGSYTGVIKDRTGRISLANQGSLFLDEIGNLSLPLQAKILSVLQNREVVPLGATQPESIDVRLISATNLDTERLHDEQFFRPDLLYRINTVEIQLPPLRERPEDIALLIDHFINRFGTKYHKSRLRISTNTYEAARNYPWPGNVRELEHAVERAVLMSDGASLKPEELIPRRPVEKKSVTNTLNLSEMEEKLIRQALRQNQGSITKAAKALGITRAALYRRLEKYNL